MKRIRFATCLALTMLLFGAGVAHAQDAPPVEAETAPTAEAPADALVEEATPTDATEPAATEAEEPATTEAAEPVATQAEEGTFKVAGTIAPLKETICNDRIDNDGDTVTDCGDADCKDDPACQSDGNAESDNARCSDWVDNDADGFTDCDDEDCQQSWVSVCKGSWKGPIDGGGGFVAGNDDDGLPPLGEGQSVEDLIGNFGDIDGERNDMVCADGIDNDGDGMTDCADFGCRFDPQVSVCRSSPGMRFSIVTQVGAEYDFQEEKPDTRFNALQMRVMGPIPMIQDSFFLLSMRTEKTPRLTFAMFQVPIGGGHYFNVNSGGGGLSSALIRSRSKQLLLDPPYYLYNAFEQGNGAAAEIGGPISSSLRYRAFAAGGSGRFAGNVGGRYFTYDNTNYTWALGGQLGVDIIGTVSRWDSPMLYTPVPQALGFAVGIKYDERAQERYPAANLQLVYRHKYVVALVESYFKRELEFISTQIAYNVAVGILVWPKHILLAADFGQYTADEMQNPPATLETDIKKQRDEMMWRVGAHWYFWRNIGVMSLIYSDKTLEEREDRPDDATREQVVQLVAQYRF